MQREVPAGRCEQSGLCFDATRNKGKHMIKFNHFNFNVLDLDKSLDFYKKAWAWSLYGWKEAEDGSFRLMYLGDGLTEFQLELTWLRDRKEPYNLGECEFHLASTPMSTSSCTRSTRTWAASALKTRPWGSTSSPIPTAIGSRSCRKISKKET